MDPLSAMLTVAGTALLFLSWGLLLATSFKEDFTWGLCTIFLPPLAFIFGFFRWSKAHEPLLIGLGGLLLLILA